MKAEENVSSRNPSNQKAKIKHLLLIRPDQMKSLKKYCQNLQDLHTIIHLVPILTTLYFKNHLQDVNLPRAQEAILLSFGFQYKTAHDVSKDLGLPVIQIHGLLTRTIKKIVNHLSNIIEKCVAEAMENREVTLEPIAQGLNEELLQRSGLLSITKCFKTVSPDALQSSHGFKTQALQSPLLLQAQQEKPSRAELHNTASKPIVIFANHPSMG
ncbi:RNA cytidine acetyltransferase [Caerostris darwini]|uniref:RNA cytidine acetyltransferase n=1 Tax=Caerostris darwini TaxID=1538125 RepID=A0AAV4WKA9_9ARAC|nr:RNA cytidine acetyltransferase [Caerostris darwini]